MGGSACVIFLNFPTLLLRARACGGTFYVLSFLLCSVVFLGFSFVLVHCSPCEDWFCDLVCFGVRLLEALAIFVCRIRYSWVVMYLSYTQTLFFSLIA